MKSRILFVLSAWVIFASPQIASANVSTLPHIETSIAGKYPEVSTSSQKIGLDLRIHFGYLGYSNSQSFYTIVDSDRKLSVPDLRSLSEAEQKDLMPISVTFSVPSPDITGAELGRFYLSSLEFDSVQEYQDFFGSPLSVFFRYIYDNPVAVKVSTSDGGSFTNWYSSNIGAKNCLFAAVKFMNPQGSAYNTDFSVSIGSNGTSARGAFFVFRADKDVNYKVTLFSSSNPYVCSGSADPSPNESLSSVIVEKSYSRKSVDFPNEILISVP